MDIKINITPMSLKNGVLGLPIECCRNWNALSSYSGEFNYAGRKSKVTFSAKHIDIMSEKASAWQFTVNDSVQFAELKIDGVHTYVEGKTIGEQLECEIKNENNQIILTVISINKKEDTKATLKIKELLKQGIRPISEKNSKAPEWNAPSEWIDISLIANYKDITDCIYIWSGRINESNTVYLYVGIVGDTKNGGKSKRNLYQRITEEIKKYKTELDVDIVNFRFCSLNNPHDFPIPELLKTIEMAEITVMTSLFECKYSQDNIDALLKEKNIVLLNKMTSYKYIR